MARERVHVVCYYGQNDDDNNNNNYNGKTRLSSKALTGVSSYKNNDMCVCVLLPGLFK